MRRGKTCREQTPCSWIGKGAIAVLQHVLVRRIQVADEKTVEEARRYRMKSPHKAGFSFTAERRNDQ